MHQWHSLEEKSNSLHLSHMHTQLVEGSGQKLPETERKLWKLLEMTIMTLIIRYDFLIGITDLVQEGFNQLIVRWVLSD